VVGFPTGGDNISITKGVVSRIDVVNYEHSGAKLMAIQIDAAINGDDK
jgi:S1-C subfamily serine protease